MKQLTTFRKVLLHHGFKPIGDMAYQHKNGEFAQILDRGKWQDCWLVGAGLRSSSFPGGWVYGSYDDLNEELTKHFNK